MSDKKDKSELEHLADTLLLSMYCTLAALVLGLLYGMGMIAYHFISMMPYYM